MQISTRESDLEQTFQFGSAPLGENKKVADRNDNVNGTRLFDLEEEEKSKEQSFGPPQTKAEKPRFSFLKNK